MASFALPPLDGTRPGTDDGPAYVLAPLENPLKGSPQKGKFRHRRAVRSPSEKEQKALRGAQYLEPSHAKNTGRHQACIDVLMGGHLEAFIELFTVSERVDDGVSLANASAELGVMKTNLVQAENAARSGDYETVYMAYKRAADHFEDAGQLRSSKQFRHKAHEAARQAGSSSKMAAAHNALGLVEEKLDDIEMSVACFVDMFRENASIDADQTTACSNLVRTLTKLAEKLERSGDVESSLAQLKEALGFSEKVDVPEMTSQCLYRIGRACEMLGDADGSIDFLEKYMNATHPATPAGRNHACSVLARCYERRGDLDTAIEYLKKLVETSAALRQEVITTESAAKLGEIYRRTGNHAESIKWYTKAYEVALNLKQPARILQLRIALGGARASALRTGFVATLQRNGPADITDMLGWKSLRREAFTAGGIETGFTRAGVPGATDEAAAAAADTGAAEAEPGATAMGEPGATAMGEPGATAMGEEAATAETEADTPAPAGDAGGDDPAVEGVPAPAPPTEW